MLVTRKAPHFVAPAVINGKEIVKDFSLEQYLGKKYVLLFFYPKDFSGVCPTEIWAFQEKLAEFEKRDCVVVGCSTDTEDTHLVWLSIPKEKGGIQGTTFPLVADTSKTIAKNYGVLGGYEDYDEEGYATFVGAPIALRGTFLIDKNGVVQHESINHFLLARNVDEYLRTLDALIYLEKHGEACPANWHEGQSFTKVSREAMLEYLSKG